MAGKPLTKRREKNTQEDENSQKTIYEEELFDKDFIEPPGLKFSKCDLLVLCVNSFM